jgi:hypothetical protein
MPVKTTLTAPGARHRIAALMLLGGLAGAIAPAQAQVTCESLSAQIEARIRASGVTSFSLRTLDVGETAPGKVVGSCDKGAKKIVYLQSAASSAAPATSPARAATPAGPAAPAARGKAGDDILTECKDGSMSVGGTCGKR